MSGFGWRAAAVYCNWLHNDKQSTLAAISSGAYDISTFGWAPVPGAPQSSVFTDQFTRSPGARYWIPSLDEWLKAAYFDPAGPEATSGWWAYPNSSNTPLVPGLPGVGDTIVGGYAPAPAQTAWLVPLEAYPHAATPWGLLDISGGSSEWVEEVYYPFFPRTRGHAGLPADRAFHPDNNIIWLSQDSSLPFGGGREGVRIATSIPSPSVLALSPLAAAGCVRRSRLRRTAP